MDRAAIFDKQWAIVQRGIQRKRTKAERMRAYRTAPAHNDHPLRHYDRTCPACNHKEHTS